MRKAYLSILAAFCLFIFALSACKSTHDQPVISSPGVAQDAAATDQPQIADTAAVSEASTLITVPDPLNNLLELRSVKITLKGLRPDGSSRSIQVEIDALGNMRLQYTLPAINPVDLLEGTDLSGISFGHEIYVIDGKAYLPSESDPAWGSNPVDPDYIPVLKSQMHGLDGFTTWLDILPTGSLQAAGNETLGGFSIDKYTVLGKVEGQQVTGSLGYDSQTHSLVMAELHIPAVLNSDPANPESGEYLITLVAEKADIPPVTLPSN
jgi:hypothetical protein